MSPLRRLASLALVAGVLAGCGAQPNSAPRSLRQQVQPATPVERPAPAQPVAGNPQAVEAARQILTAVAVAKRNCQTWTGKSHCDVWAPDGSRNWNSSQVFFKAPSTMAATVLKAKDEKCLKTRVVYRGGSDIDLKTYFFGFIAIKLTIAVDDSRLVDAYNRSLRDTQTSQLMNTILHPGAKATVIGASTVHGEAVDLIDIVSPGSWKDVSHEIVGISRKLSLPISRDVYDARNKRMFHMELEGMRINVQPKGNDLTLD